MSQGFALLTEFSMQKMPILRKGVFSRTGKRSFFVWRFFPEAENADFARGSFFPKRNSLLFCGADFSRTGIRSFFARESFPEVEFAPFLQSGFFPRWNSLLFCGADFSRTGKCRFCARESFAAGLRPAYRVFLRKTRFIAFPMRKKSVSSQGLRSLQRTAKPC